MDQELSFKDKGSTNELMESDTSPYSYVEHFYVYQYLSLEILALVLSSFNVECLWTASVAFTRYSTELWRWHD